VRAVIQRTDKASVTIDGKEIAAIGRGLTVFLGVGQEDTFQDAEYMADKIVNLRIFPDQEGKMNLSLLDIGGELLVVSQFTLYGDCRKGRRPSFVAAGEPAMARQLYEQVISLCASRGIRVVGGQFQAEMVVNIVNHGPVTMLLDSKRLF